MPENTPSFHYLFIFALLLPILAFANSDELQLVLNIKNSIRSPNDIFDTWEPNNSVCNFTGITCDDIVTVKGIELSHQNLTGSIPLDSVCGIQSLERLSVGFNFLNGRVTEDLNKCVKLKYLDLGNNFFQGHIPDISAISGLEFLYVNNSGFSGAFPWKSLANMTDLTVLSVGDNPFDQTTSFPYEVATLLKLNWLYMSNCSIGGQIPPEIGNLTELIDLELSMNFLTGTIPNEITKLSKLWQLELYGNQLTGTLPDGFRNLTSLQMFDASQNSLVGNLSEIRFMTQIMSLQLFSNNLSGVVPPEIGEFKYLVNLSLYGNELTGTLPRTLGSFADFNFIDISENFLTGEIPPDMCKNGKMTELLVLQNNFIGGIPESYANCTTLTRFRVSRNSLTGVVPGGIWGLPLAEIIDIELNYLEGDITSDIQNAKTLGQIYAANNRLSGDLPMEISKASSLYYVDLSHNQFSGKIPDSIGELSQLSTFYLDNNMFSGEIPETLGSCRSLSDINFANNSFSGQIPATLGHITSLTFINLSDNKLSGQIPSSLSSLKLSILDLSHNELSGPIPESLSIEAYNGSFAGNNGLCSEKVKYFRHCAHDTGMSPELRTLISCSIVLVVAMLLLLSYFLYLKKSRKEKAEHSYSFKEDSWDFKSFHLLSFTEDDIIDSIKQENVIGRGGSGNVYKVVLQNGVELAVKHIWNLYSGGRKESRSSTPMLRKQSSKFPEFEAEVQTLSSIRHVNVVKLYCSITSEDSSLLVYEYMPNGSLWDRLHSCKKLGLDWDTRYEIAVGAAKGLEYLHHGCEKPVIHRDVKSSNILLDELMKPRIADFGLAKIVQSKTSTDPTQVIAGTHGYIAPEYGYTYKVNEKSDVYSFGVVLMELVTGKRPIEVEFGDNKDIVDWVCSKLKNKESVLSLIDSTIGEAYNEDAIKVLKIAIMCTARLPALRPTMRAVVQMLDEAEPCKLVSILVSKDGDGKKVELDGDDKL